MTEFVLFRVESSWSWENISIAFTPKLPTEWQQPTPIGDYQVHTLMSVTPEEQLS